MTNIEIRLHNTLTKEREALQPFDPNNVRMYVCGPTVYDFAHIGNARPVIVFDVLFRLLRHVYGAEHVTYVRNITDVDDKINARALRDHPGLPLNEAIRLVTEKTARQFHNDVAALGNLEPSIEPRATDNIDQMKVLIQTLLDQGHAYVASGEEGLEVLFDVQSMPDYGGLSKRNLDEQQAGARIAEKDHKKNPGDFVLWKESAADLPGWDAGFTVTKKNRKALRLNDDVLTIHGRPGWHIECSAMSERYLWAEIEQKLSGEAQAHPHQFDIHGGGLDLIFPHHENEIAQSRCAHGTPTMAQIWMHNGFLQVEGQKMSKSLGNFVTIRDVLSLRTGSAMRLAMLLSHYRQPIDWTNDKLDSASDEVMRWASTIYESEAIAEFEADLVGGKRRPIDHRVIAALCDDLNTPAAISGVREIFSTIRSGQSDQYDLLNALHFLGLIDLRRIGALVGTMEGSAPVKAFSEHGNDYLLAQVASANGDPGVIEYLNSRISDEGLVLKVHEGDGRVTFDDTQERGDPIDSLIADRLAALAAKDFAKADAIRAELLEQGIQLMDYKDPDSGERKTKWEIKR